MADGQDETAESSVFKALADPTRRQILRALRHGELAAGEVASGFPISGPSISRHLAVLKAAGLVEERRQANKIIYSLAADRLAQSVGSYLSAVCPDQVPERHQRKNKAKISDKAVAKNKRRSPARKAARAADPVVDGNAHDDRPAGALTARV